MKYRDKSIVVANPSLVLREEYDDWALLFDPDTSVKFGLNPVSAYIYKSLDGTKTLDEIVRDLQKQCTNVPDNVGLLVYDFVEDLINRGMAEHKPSHDQS